MKKITTLIAVAALALLAASPVQATPVTIDFDGLTSGDFTGPATEDGFTLTATGARISSLAFLVSGFSQPNYIVTDGTGNWLLTLAESDASAFKFLGLDGASVSTAVSASLTVRGFQGATLVGTDNFSVSSGNIASNFNATSLLGLALTRVEIEGQYGGNTTGLSAFADNIRLETDATISAVPEPASLALFAIGVAGLGLRRRAG